MLLSPSILFFLLLWIADIYKKLCWHRHYLATELLILIFKNRVRFEGLCYILVLDYILGFGEIGFYCGVAYFGAP